MKEGGKWTGVCGVGGLVGVGTDWNARRLRGGRHTHTLSQACSHTPSGSEGHRVDKTTIKHKQGSGDTFSHTHIHIASRLWRSPSGLQHLA